VQKKKTDILVGSTFEWSNEHPRRRRNILKDRRYDIFPSYSTRSTLLFASQDRNEDDDVTEFVGGDKDNKPTRRGQFRKVVFNLEANENSNIAVKLLESLSRFLFRPVLLPLNFGKKRKNFPSVPLFYVLAVISSASIFPLVTWAMLAVFFAIYLTLGMAFMDEYDDLGIAIDDSIDNQNERRDFFEQGKGDNQKLVPLASFVGAVASAGLLSPQGLISVGGTFSPASPIALFTLAIGFVALAGGIWGFDDVEKRWEEKDVRQRVGKNERRKMDQWDEELKKK